MKDVLDVYKAGDSFNEEEQRMIISAVTGQVGTAGVYPYQVGGIRAGIV